MTHLLAITDQSVVEIGLSSLVLSLKLGGPVLGVALGVGLLIGLLQSVTQLQEQTITFVPKLLAVGVVLLVSGSWMLGEAVQFTRELFDKLPQFLS